MSKKNDNPPPNIIWKSFYKDGEDKPSTEEKFIEDLKDTHKRKYLLTDGMENFVNQKLAKSLTKTQMRNIFNLAMNEKDEISLQVRLTYIAGKADKWDIKNFIRLLINIYKSDSIEKDLTKSFIESVLAYHKFYAKR